MFSSLRLNTKLIGSVVAVALVTVFLALIAIYGLDTAMEQLNSLFSQSRKQKAAADVNAEFQLAISKGKNFAMLRDDVNKGKTLAHLKNAQDAAALLISLAGAEEERKIFSDISKGVDAVAPRLNTLTSAAMPADKAEDLYHSYLENITEPFDKAISSYVVALDLRTAQDLQQKIRATKALLIVGVLLAALGLGLNLSVALNVSRKLKVLIGSLNEGVSQVATGSAQVAGSSQQLAEGASESASSLEETSSSMEEMSAMTRQNSENAFRAKGLMEETRLAVAKGSQAVQSTLGSMAEMDESAAKVSRIIKTIEEIAFQTNLLALNAAVEAARAGEHGRGFAVVADEVRNLASRSAAAARDTAALIEENARKVGQGMQVSAEAGQSLREIVESSAKAAALVGDIATASQEQARGIGEINSAIGQMDQVTQRVTANAEELSSASEEMSGQAGMLRDMVRQLVRLVEGKLVPQAVEPSHSSWTTPQRPRPSAFFPLNQAKDPHRNGKGRGQITPSQQRDLVLAAADLKNF